MDTKVVCEVTFQCKSLSTLTACKRFLPRMDTKMLSQVTFLSKCLSTMNTCKRLLSRMAMEMVFQENAFSHWLHAKRFTPDGVGSFKITSTGFVITASVEFDKLTSCSSLITPTSRIVLFWSPPTSHHVPHFPTFSDNFRQFPTTIDQLSYPQIV